MAAFPQTIAGLPAKQVRDLLFFCGLTFYAQRIAMKLKWPLKRAVDLMLALEKEGYVERLKVDEDLDISWQRSRLGQRLVCARFGQRLKRATAEGILDGVVERVRALNQQAHSVKYVSRLCVFGSYLDPKVATLGDIDLGYSLSPRPGVEAEKDYRRAWALDRDYLRFVRGRSAYVAMNPMSVVEAMKTQVRELLTASDAEVPAFDRARAGSVLDW